MNFRRVILAMTVLALFVGLASAQTDLQNQLTCTVSADSSPALRAEGKTELVGDLLVRCSGGSDPAVAGLKAKGVDITVEFSAPVTSKKKSDGLDPAHNYTEALLLVDDPQTVAAAAAIVPGYGNNANLTSCTGFAFPGNEGSDTAACDTYAIKAANGYYVAANAYDANPANAATAANAYIGILTGEKKITFYGVPMVAPVSKGIRQFRIANVRVTPGSADVTATVSVAGKNKSLFVLNNTQAKVGTGQAAFTTKIINANNATNVAQVFSQCISPVIANGTGNIALLQFKEAFANAAKLQGAAAAPAAGAFYQYGGTTTEGGIVVPAAWLGAGANTGVAGSATRFKAVFTGLPANTKIYVSNKNLKDGFYTDANGASQAQFTKKEADAFAAYDGANIVNPGNAVVVAPVVAPQANQITVDENGKATAIWEVTAAAADATDTFTFAVYMAYNGAAAVTDANVTLSVAPVNPAAAAAVQIPAFVDNGSAQPLLKVTPCQTTLLFPFVSSMLVDPVKQTAWETGVAISNTGADPFNTVAADNEGGKCDLNFYGAGAPAKMTTPNKIAPGQQFVAVVSDPANTGTKTYWTGYMFAVCNFSFAHGFAFVEDDTRSMAMGYLASVVDNGGGVVRSAPLNGEALGQ